MTQTINPGGDDSPEGERPRWEVCLDHEEADEIRIAHGDGSRTVLEAPFDADDVIKIRKHSFNEPDSCIVSKPDTISYRLNTGPEIVTDTTPWPSPNPPR